MPSESERSARAQAIVNKLKRATAGMTEPAVTQIINEHGRNPFFVLVSCLLSLRTKDTTSLPVSQKLFRMAQTPQELLDIPVKTLEQLIYPVGFYRQKTKTLRAVSQLLTEQFGARVPQTEGELLSLPGVGRKTANLVLGEAFGIPAICVDTHVHRISNRLGLVKTKTPEQTEYELQKILPKKEWIDFNRLLVIWGQNVCAPLRPHCNRCALADICPKIGVKRKS